MNKKKRWILLFCLWYAMGVSGMLYVFAGGGDVTLKDVPLVLGCGFFGPVPWLSVVGQAIPDGPVLIPQR